MTGPEQAAGPPGRAGAPGLGWVRGPALVYRDEVATETARTLEDLAQARTAHAAALDALQRLDASLPGLTDEREIPRLFGAGAKRADPPPPGWKAK